MFKIFTKEIIKPYPVPEYIILNVENFNNWFNSADKPSNVYAHPGIFLRTDKLSLSHVLDYIYLCYGIEQKQSSAQFGLYKFLDEIRKDWIERLNKQ